MSGTDGNARIAELNTGLIAPAATPVAPVPPATAAPAVGGASDFSRLLQSAGAGAPMTAASVVPAGTGGAGVLAAVQREVGVAEQPPGSNDAPRIAQYRQATAGSGVGPWCAYFASWAARESGMPLGENGQGFGSVDALYGWAQRTGRAVPNGPGVVPRPGDLIVWDEHVGVVESVQPDGSVATIEGNSSDQVSRRVHEAGSALGYVRMG
ncbi:MAG: hypothetical protein QOH83_1157 [Solirubrobacteraceae bacterium]|nr:hypothetical protein [Solirubrobacteraceae bacterium]